MPPEIDFDEWLSLEKGFKDLALSRLKEMSKKASQRAIAKTLGAKQPYICHWLSGTNPIPRKYMKKLLG